MAWNTCRGWGGAGGGLPHPPHYRSHGTDLLDILVLLCTGLVEWYPNLICKPLGLFEGNHLLFWIIILVPHCMGPVHASGGGTSACIRGWDQCMEQIWVLSCVHPMVHWSPVRVFVCMQTEYRWLGKPGYARVGGVQITMEGLVEPARAAEETTQPCALRVVVPPTHLVFC